MPFQELTSTSRLDFSFDNVEGLQILFVRNLIAQSLEAAEPGVADILAEAVEKPQSNTINWHTSVTGKVKPYEDLDLEEKNQVNSQLAQKAQLIAKEGERLKESKSQQKQLAGKVLEKIALSIASFVANPGPPLQVFLVGEKAVVAGWGLVPIKSVKDLNGELSESSRDSAMYILESGAVPPALVLEKAKEPEEGRGTAAPPPIVPIVPVATESGCLWNLLRVLLAALLTLLLLSLLFFLLFPELRLLFTRAPFYDPTVTDTLEERLYSFKLDYLEKIEACPVEEAQLKVPLEKTSPVYQEEPEEDPSELYSVAPPKPEPTPEPKPTPKETPKETPKVGGAMNIPDGDPNDLSFLEGCWKSDAGVFEVTSKRPVYDIYCFDKNGRGTLKTELYDKKGNKADTCTTSASATRSANRVVIVDNGAKCPKEKINFTRYQMNCQKSSNERTQCNIRGRDSGSGQKPFDNKFTYLGKN